MGLNEHQQRTVTVTLRLFEQRLSDVERALQKDEVGILYHRHMPFTPTQVNQMHSLIAAMRAEIQHAVTQFHLEREEINTARYIVGTLGLSWESLEDARPDKLSAYGAVDPELYATLDPILRRLIELLFGLEDVARRDGRPHPSDRSARGNHT